MDHARLLKFKLLAPTNHNWKRLSVTCPRFSERLQFIWNNELANDTETQVNHILINRLGFREEEVICYSEDELIIYVMLTNHERHLKKEGNH